MRFSTQQEDYIYNRAPCYDYEVRGSSEYTLGENYTENNFSSLVYFKEKENKQIDFKTTHFFQTSKGLVYQLAQDFSSVTSELLLQLNGKGQVTQICNLEQIQQIYQEQKPILLEKYNNIPDFETVVKNYETNIQKEEKLRNSLFYYGIYRIFFAGIKELVQRHYPNRQVARTRKYNNYIFTVDLPVVETITIDKHNEGYRVTLKGKIDLEQLDEKQFLDACRTLYGKDILLSNILFETKETYELDLKLNYHKGSYSHHFEIKGKEVKTDYIEYKLKKHSFV
ncbi:hypothetical protein [Apibacter sp. HY039]|uniref:hypothetical protein n=1 Tax=Apibacter sp. HY039 TaxID=2501476 RepID=UPI000FEC0DAE|nr:hypothetical protein [Apibacter sp. HY039]